MGSKDLSGGRRKRRHCSACGRKRSRGGSFLSGLNSFARRFNNVRQFTKSKGNLGAMEVLPAGHGRRHRRGGMTWSKLLSSGAKAVMGGANPGDINFGVGIPYDGGDDFGPASPRSGSSWMDWGRKAWSWGQKAYKGYKAAQDISKAAKPHLSPEARKYLEAVGLGRR